jgi:hypothetical protein
VPKRPVAVTVIAVLAIVSGIVAPLAGIVVLGAAAASDVAERANTGPGLLVYLGLWSIIGGCCQLVGGTFLFRGANWARLLLTAVLVLHLGLNGVNAVSGVDRPTTVFLVAVFAVPAIALLWTRPAHAWFTRHAA